MKDAACSAFLDWALPRLGLRSDGYRNVRGQVCKRIHRRSAALQLSDLAAYRSWLEAHPEEWTILEGLCAVTISRFYRDRGVWDALRDDVLPQLAEAALAAGDGELRCWSMGCASGEEPYTLSLMWNLRLAPRFPRLRLRILATDVGEPVLARAREGLYASGTVRDLPRAWLEAGFERREASFLLRDRFRGAVELRRQDVQRAVSKETFRLILCRNVVLTYFDEARRREALESIVDRLSAGGAFVSGLREQRPHVAGLEPWHAELGIYAARRAAS